MGTYRDMNGYCSGELRAVEQMGKDKNGHSLWRCVCGKCGRTDKVVNYTLLVSGKLKDCGCATLRGYDLHGAHFGALDVVKPVGLDRNKRRVWLVKCSMCKKKSAMTASKLVNCDPRCPYCGA